MFVIVLAFIFLSTQFCSCAEKETHSLVFELRQQHAATYDGRVVFANIPTSRAPSLAQDHALAPYKVDVVPTKAHKLPRGISPILLSSQRRQRARSHPKPALTPQSISGPQQSFPEDHWDWWDTDDILGPDVTKRNTLLHLAKMTNNAYLEPDEAGWYDLGPDWTVSYPVGWEPDDDGFRGHVFATPDNSTVVLSIKGTSAGWLGGTGPTGKKDKFNDNLLFSCCCAYVDWTWTTVCGCAKGGWKCDQGCLEESLISESLFYPIGINLYNNLTYMYPDSNIWVIGHSLGGSLASLLGATFGAPVVAFEAPGEKMAAARLHLPTPPSTLHITHVYNTADTIPMGACTGVTSACALGGYALESKCHLGRSIIYDTIIEAGWSAGIANHGIVKVIEELLNNTWTSAEEVGREVPEPKLENDCVECYRWEYANP